MKNIKEVFRQICEKRKNRRSHYIGIGAKLAIILTIMFFLASIVSGIILVVFNLANYFETESIKHTNICKVVADLADENEILGYYESRVADARYYELVKRVSNAVNTQAKGSRLYVFVPEDDKLVMIIGVKNSDSNAVELGRELPYDESDEIIMPAVRAGKASQSLEVVTHNDGIHYMCSWAPIFDEQKNVVAFVEFETEVVAFAVDYFENLGHPFRNRFLSFALFLIVIMFLIHKTITGPIKDLTKYIDSYENGKFRESTFKLKGNNEITYLARAFSQMNERIEEYVIDSQNAAKEAEKSATEMGIASGIQYSMLNTEFPAFPDRKEFDLHAIMKPAAYVGGDFYDFFFVDDTHLALVIADVSGGSVSGAMFMMRAMTNIKNYSMVLSDPAAILGKVNNELCTHNSEGMFVTVWIGILDITTGNMVCANGGHEYPFIQRAGSKFEIMYDEHDLVLGGIEDISYRDYEIKLEPGDRIYVYTDGVPECMDENDNQFGMDAAIDVLNGCLGQTSLEVSAQMLDDKVYEALKEHMGNAMQYDDITMLCLKYIGNAAKN